MLGRRNPVEKIIKLVHEKGGVVLGWHTMEEMLDEKKTSDDK